MIPSAGRVRTLAIFGTARIREYVVPEGRAKPAVNDPAGLLGLHHVRSGEIHIEAPEGARRFGEGDAFAINHDSQLPYAPLGDLRVLSIVLPAEVLAGVGAPAAGEVRAVTSENPLLAPSLAFARQAVQVDDETLGGFGRYYFERLLQEMVIGVMVGDGRSAPTPPSSGWFASALAVIAAQRADPALSPRSVAQQAKISLRQLQRVFHQNGTTVEHEIRRSRVEYATALLRDRSYDAMSIDAIGRYAGFAGGSSLARAMAAEGLERPTAIRAASRLAAGSRPTGSN